MKQMSLSLFLLFTASAPTLTAEDAFLPVGDESANYQTEVVVDGLDNPCGLVARPAVGPEDPREILFIESGAGRVLKFSGRQTGNTQEVLTGLSVNTSSSEPDLRTSGWRLGFITPTKLAVLGGTQRNDIEQIAVFVLPEDEKTITAEQPDHSVTVVGDTASQPLVFPGMVVGETTAYFTSGSVHGAGALFKAALAANRIEEPRPLVYIKSEDDLRWPSGSCLSPSRGTQFLVTGHLGELTGERDSRITFVVPSSGVVALKLACGLYDIVDVAYSPSGQLYAIDLAWRSEIDGGVYRLDDARHENRPACRAVKIAEVARPTSLLFDANGTLYITSWGTGEKTKQGSLIKINGEF